MDKGLGNESSSISSSTFASITNNSNSNSNMFLNQVNKNSHKIAKPFRKPLPLPNPTAAASPTIPVTDPSPNNPGLGQAPPQSQQPPVYNINKNDFRDVVQKLTGSPAHERLPPPPPPVTHPRPPSSRLQRIRPPPLAQISNQPNQITQILPGSQVDHGHRPPAHGLPLPPLPSVHPAAESPISAYMRFLQNSASSLAPSPLWNGVALPIGGPRLDSLPPQNEFGQRPPPLQPAESPISAYTRFLQSSAVSSSTAPPPQPPLVPPPSQPPLTSSAVFPAMPLSPLPFGCIPSPRSPYGMTSPGFLFSPTGQLGLPQLPLSPTFPVPNPRWKGM